MMQDASTKKGGYTKRQINIGQKRFPGKWKSKMIGQQVPLDFWERFVAAAGKKGKGYSQRKKKKLLNTISPDKGDDWSWKPTLADIPKLKSSKNNKNQNKNKIKKQKVTKLSSKEFYMSKEWRILRVKVLEKFECKCMMCGRSPKEHGIVIHVDHIKPRSNYPELALSFNNLQLLCEDCNLGKLNRYETDWRPDPEDNHEISLVIAANERF